VAESRVELAISGDLTIKGIDAIHAQLAAELPAHSNVILNISDVVEADLTFVQLIESARLSAAQRGARLALRAPVDEVLRAMLERGGFLDPSDPARARFWLEGAQ
jgi:ABC-type transporter Mla MlaB component